jgi:hypothetical protein
VAELPPEAESALERLARALAGDVYHVRPALGEEALAKLLRELWRGVGIV